MEIIKIVVIIAIAAAVVCFAIYRLYLSSSAGSLDAEVTKEGAKMSLKKENEKSGAIVSGVKIEKSSDVEISADGKGAAAKDIEIKEGGGVKVAAKTSDN